MNEQGMDAAVTAAAFAKYCAAYAETDLALLAEQAVGAKA